MAAVRKIFIGGISYDTTDESLRLYFETFGPVVDSVVLRDATTGRSRGFGFVTFESASSVTIALRNREHVIDGRRVEAKAAIPKSLTDSPPSSPISTTIKPQSAPYWRPLPPAHQIYSSPLVSPTDVTAEDEDMDFEENMANSRAQEGPPNPTISIMPPILSSSLLLSSATGPANQAASNAFSVTADAARAFFPHNLSLETGYTTASSSASLSPFSFSSGSFTLTKLQDDV